MRLRSVVGAFLASSLTVAGLGDPAGTSAHARQASTLVAGTERFAFHSDPWINLHHFLYQWARADQGLQRGRQRVPVPERETLAELPDADRRSWLEALDFYRQSVAGWSHFDDPMLVLKRRLRELGGDPGATPPDDIPGVSRALAIAMPVYLEHWWPAHDAANRAWVEGVAPRVERHEARFVALTERIYGADWPDETWRADVSAYANWAGGYTAFGHIMIWSTDPGNQGVYGTEMLFHEVQHTRAVNSPAREGLQRVFQEAGTRAPGNLWHALIFATAGEFARSIARAEGLPPHTPYWIREGFQTFGGWRDLVPVVNEHWLPVVRGEVSREDAFAAFVRILGPSRR